MKALMLALGAAAAQRRLVGVVRLVGAGEESAAPVRFVPPSSEAAELLRGLGANEREVVAAEGEGVAAAMDRHVHGLFGQSVNVTHRTSSARIFTPERVCPRLLADRFDPARYALTPHEQQLWGESGLGTFPGTAALAELHEELLLEGEDARARTLAALRASLAFNLHDHFAAARNLSLHNSPQHRLTKFTSFGAHDALRYETFGLIDTLLEALRALRTEPDAPRFTLLVGPAAKLLELLAAFHMSTAACVAALPPGAAEAPLCRFFPAPGSSLDLELFRAGKEVLVRAIYNGEEASLCPSDAVWCPWAEFEVSLDETMKSDFGHYCSNGEKLLFSPGRMGRKRIGYLLFALGLAGLLVGLRRRWPELTGRRPSWRVSPEGVAPPREKID